MAFLHETVLLEETVSAIVKESGLRYIDCTLGGAGHSELLLSCSNPKAELMVFDQDEIALAHANTKLAPFQNRVVFIHSNFREVFDVATEHDFTNVDGIMFDLGVSSPQFDEAGRGFSYKLDAPLDMRMDQNGSVTAAALVRDLDEGELASIFFRFGEEKFSRRIARSIVKERESHPIESTTQLAEIVKNAIPAATRRSGGHPAKRVFQALRIAVNDELGALTEALQGAFQLLSVGGRLGVITFHSLEDRIVKHAFLEWTKGCVCPPDFPICRCGKTPLGKLVYRKPIVPTEREIELNPRSRSAKLRVIERISK